MRNGKLFGLAAGALMACSTFAAEEAQSLNDEFVGALKGGKVKGTIGTYMEGKKYDDEQFSKGKSQGDEFSWGTGYVSLGYTTGQFKGFSIGLEFLGHFELWSSDDDKKGYFHKDIEDGSEFSMPQAYLQYNFTDKTEVVVGRWNHQKFTHFDDAQAEGAFFRTRDLVPNVDFTVGVATAFAELDYDDAEDWDYEVQNFDNEKYGEDSWDFVLFSELVWDVVDGVSVNPYVYYQDEYAAVYGVDLDAGIAVTEAVTVGARTASYFVDDLRGDDLTANPEDAFCWSVTPYVEVTAGKAGKVTLEAGYAAFDGSDMNKPAWLRDYIIGVLDQDNEYAADESDVVFGRITWALGPFWAHYAVGYYHDIDDEDRVTENEVQLGYKITKNVDVNLRLFDVDYDTGASDYQKFEFRGRVRF
ncbi:MAG: hypothetical protein RRC34_02010 [Lentisphaeria bacterium]|nr:hypothetical protein [Lentisphaeria bacterium]